MRQMTGSFSLESGSIALAPSITSVQNATVTPYNPTPTPDDPGDDQNLFGIWEILGFVTLGILILFLLICTIHCCYDKYMQEEQYVQIDEGTEEDRKDFK